MSEEMITKFKHYLELTYSNKKTQELYFSAGKTFLSKYPNAKELTQEMIDEYVINMNRRKESNPFYRAFITTIHNCFDPDNKLKLKVREDKSREKKKIDKYKFLSIEKIQELIVKTSPYISLTIKLMFETGLRKEVELLSFDLSKKECKLNLIERRIIGIGKMNKEYNQKFSEGTAKLLHDWLKICRNPETPFAIYKKNGQLLKNQGFAYWKRLRKETEFLGIKTEAGDPVSPHCIRHSILHYLKQDLNWDLLDVAKFGRHSDPKVTMRYSAPTREKVEKKVDEELFDIKGGE